MKRSKNLSPIITILFAFGSFLMWNSLTTLDELKAISVDKHSAKKEFVVSFKKDPKSLKIISSSKGAINKMKERIGTIDQDILKISKEHKVDPKWVAAVIWTESHFNQKAKSHIGATGLMQITHSTAKYICKTILKKKRCSHLKSRKNFQKLFANDPHLNITYGVAYLKFLQKKFNNDHKLATLAYNEGPTRIKRLASKINNNEIFTEHQYFIKIDKRMKLIAAL